MDRRRLACSFLAGLAVVALSACASTSRSGRLAPGTSQPGKYLSAFSGPEIEAIVGYRFADSNLGSDWMILDVAVSGIQRKGVKVQREGVYLVTPRGDHIPMPDQKTFAEAYGSLQRDIRAASVSADPLDYFPGTREACDEWFFVRPGAGLAHDQITVHDRRVCQGWMFFPVPGGTAKGNWTLAITTPEGEARLPFRLEPAP